MSRILVVGSTGLLGRALMRRLGAEAAGTGRSRLAKGTLALDALDSEAVSPLVRKVQPQIVVNLVAERRPAYWGNLKGLYAANVATASHVATAARTYGADLIHVSTDYVFASGGPYTVDAHHAPTNAYGATKSTAESIVRHAHGAAVTVRVPVLYGPVERVTECNLAELVHRLTSTEGSVALDTWAQRRPTHVDDVAESLALVMGSIETWRGRTVHLSATGWHSQFEMGQVATALLGIDPSILSPVSNERSDRPRRIELQLDDATPYLPRYRSLHEGLAQLYEGYVAYG